MNALFELTNILAASDHYAKTLGAAAAYGFLFAKIEALANREHAVESKKCLTTICKIPHDCVEIEDEEEVEDVEELEEDVDIEHVPVRDLNEIDEPDDCKIELGESREVSDNGDEEETEGACSCS